MVTPLPIDAVLSEVIAAQGRGAPLVLEAPPGAGKTTRVPWALFQAHPQAGEVIVAEPRRLAARLTATRVASERGERIGETVGYSVRFDEVSGPKTRIRYVTEGVLLRRLMAEPELPGVAHVVLDEFHERSLLSDLLLVLLQKLRARRPSLGLTVMSATLDAEPIAKLLQAERVRSEGRTFPLSIEHLPTPDDRPLDKQVVSAVRTATGEPGGDVLVFLPGSSEIRRALAALEPLARERDLLLLPLHGDLPLAEQARAVEPAPRRKVILSTNVAETSVTIDGVTWVVDSGLSRQASHSPWSGLPTLTTAKISRASATQRAGRAGRTQAGRVLRLYTKGDFEARREHELPEIARADLSETLLALAFVGIDSPRELPWLSPPPEAALAAAQSLLSWLGAVDAGGRISALGRRMLEIPLHPRLSRVMLRGEELGVASESCLAASLLAERDIRTDARLKLGPGGRRELGASGPCDVLELMSRFGEADAVNFRPDAVRHAGLDVRSVQAVANSRRKLASLTRKSAPRPSTPDAEDDAVRRAILAGFPDRVGRRRRAGQPDIVLSQGGAAKLAETSVVHEGELVVAVAADEQSFGGRAQGVIRLATSIEPSWLLDDFGQHIEMKDELVWNAAAERVERLEGMAFGSILLDESRSPAPSSVEASRILFEAAKAKNLFGAMAAEGLGGLSSRLQLLREHFPELELPSVGASGAPGDAAAERSCAGRTSFAELRELDPAAELRAQLGPTGQRLLATEVPEQLQLPGGRKVEVHYEPGKPPWIESRLQDFFGMKEGPRICRGKVVLTLHLLAPNGRAQQVTSDLSGFWERHYPTVRRELMRKYPRHPWPEDGRNATPPVWLPRPPRR